MITKNTIIACGEKKSTITPKAYCQQFCGLFILLL